MNSHKTEYEGIHGCGDYRANENYCQPLKKKPQCTGLGFFALTTCNTVAYTPGSQRATPMVHTTGEGNSAMGW